MPVEASPLQKGKCGTQLMEDQKIIVSRLFGKSFKYEAFVILILVVIIMNLFYVIFHSLYNLLQEYTINILIIVIFLSLWYGVVNYATLNSLMFCYSIFWLAVLVLLSACNNIKFKCLQMHFIKMCKAFTSRLIYVQQIQNRRTGY